MRLVTDEEVLRGKFIGPWSIDDGAPDFEARASQHCKGRLLSKSELKSGHATPLVLWPQAIGPSAVILQHVCGDRI
jgi:hypothetical protein